MSETVNALLLCLGLVLGGAEHAPDASAWAWAANATGVALLGLLAWRCQDHPHHPQPPTPNQPHGETMKKLSKDQKKQRDVLVATLEDAVSDANLAIEEYNDLLQALTPPTDQLEAVNVAIEALNEWRDDINTQIADYVAERSEAWREGERGAQHEEWQATYADYIDDVYEYVDLPEEIDECWVEIPASPNSPEDV
jgi:hypothetical protein